MQSGGVFVGREREMAVLLEAVEQAVSGAGSLVLIAGEPGIGKSRLADELADEARARGLRVIWGRCWEAGGAPAYWPWVQALRSYVRGQDAQWLRIQMGPGAPDIAQILPELRDMLPDLPSPPPLDPEGARFRLFDSTAAFLRNGAHTQPLVLILDDLHAADVPSLLLLRFVAREITDAHMIIVATYRDTELSRHHSLTPTLVELTREQVTRTLLLGGLARSDVTRFIELAEHLTPSQRLVTAIHRETEGNPLFISEVIQFLAHEGRLEDKPGSEFVPFSIPQSVREVIGRRLSQLSVPCHDMLTRSSVLGFEFNVDVLSEVSDSAPDELLELIGEAIASRAVYEVPGVLGRVRFAHTLIRDTLYDELTVAQRTRLHRQFGQALERRYGSNLDPHLAELAHHFIAAAPMGDVDKAVDYARRAGDQAARGLAYEEAVRLYKMALRALDLTPSAAVTLRGDLLLSLGDAEVRAGDLVEAKDTFLRAAEIARQAGSADQLAHAALGYGGRGVWGRAGSDPHLIPLLESALAVLGDDDSALRVQVLARLACALRDSHSREPRASLSEQGVAMARRLGLPRILAYALNGRSWAIFEPNTVEERLVIASETIQVAEQAGDKERANEAHLCLAMTLFELGSMSGVYKELDALARSAEELRQPVSSWLWLVMRTLLALFEGRFQDAEGMIAQAFSAGERSQPSDAISHMRLHTLTLRREQGRQPEVESSIRRSVDEFPWYPMFRCALARLYAETGRADAAREMFERLAADRFAALPRDNEWIFSLTLLAEVAAYLGHRDHAATLYDMLSPYGTRCALGSVEGINGSVFRYLGTLAATMARWDEAEHHFERALEANQAMGARPFVAWTQYDYARMLETRASPGERVRAQSLLHDALETARALGMALLERMVMGLPGDHLAPTDVRAAVVTPRAASPRPSLLRREGEYWSVVFEDDAFRLRDSKGLHYIARLLANPGQEFPALDLVRSESDRNGAVLARAEPGVDDTGFHEGLGDAGPQLDAEAKAAYRARLKELDEELEEATSWNDPERAARAREERQFLLQELSAAVGLGGRDRPTGSAAERARINVTRAIKSTLVRIQLHSPALSRHLSSTIRTGLFCSYNPDPRVPTNWQS